MEQHTGSQYDDDLTVGMDEYDDSFQTGNVDLFEFVGDEESPITRLKTLILSIDWEISDDILRQFNIELLDLKDIWANNKINLVYVQALEKISKYIYQEKANANPNAIKLLLNLYTNLEKIVSTESMPEEEKRRLLMEDVEKFEKLKKQIGRSSGKPQAQAKKPSVETAFKTAPAFRLDEPLPTMDDAEDPLLNLKAIVFGMDWEITEADLMNLGEEVRRLEKKYSNSKAKLIFLQGIGALGAYINLKRSNAHADAFKLLHSFFLSLETCVRNGLTGEDEKRLLLPEVEKFNAFKAAIASTISPEGVAEEEKEEEEAFEDRAGGSGQITPAFADMPEDVHGFQEEEEASSLGEDAKQRVEGQVDKFFDEDHVRLEKESAGDLQGGKNELIGEMESRLQGFFGNELAAPDVGMTSKEIALQGVAVETDADDDSEEEALPRQGDELAPALSETFEESSFSEDAIAGVLSDEGGIPSDAEDRIEGAFGAAEASGDMAEIAAALQGVEVETEADDDSEEEPLPRTEEEVAPALFALDTEEEPEAALSPSEESLGLETRLEEFFSEEPAPAVDEQSALKGVDVGGEEEELEEGDAFSPAMYSLEEGPAEEGTKEETVALDFFEETAGIDEIETVDVMPAESTIEAQREPVAEAEELHPALIDLEGEIGGAEPLQPAVTGEPVAALSEDDGSLLFEAEEPLPEETAAVDIEDHLKDFFQEEDTEAAPEETKTLDFSEVMAQPEEEAESVAPFAEEAEAFFLKEEEIPDFPAEMKEGGLSEEESGMATERKDAAPDFDFAFDEDVSLAVEDGEAEKPEEIAAFEAASEEEPSEFFAVEEESLGETAADEQGVREEEEGADVFASSFFAATPEEPAETPLFAGIEEPVSEAVPKLQDDDFIEYIEGVEFDDEEEALGSAIEAEEHAEEVVFEAVEDDAEAAGGESISFDDLEEEFEKYLTAKEEMPAPPEMEAKQPGALEGLFDDHEVFGQGLEKGPAATEKRVSETMTAGSEGDASRLVEDLMASLEGVRPQAEGREHLIDPTRELHPPTDDLSQLRSCIASLGLEINDSIVGSLLNELNTLQNLWITKPVEKTFLQLMSTVAQHIDRYRHESSPEAHGLLMSVFDKLEQSRLSGIESMEVQEALHSETTKILLWQQKMLSRKAAEPGDDYAAVFETVDDEAMGKPAFAPGSVPRNGGAVAGLDIESDMIRSEVDTAQITRIVKDEFEMLRQSFRSEMADLLRQYFDRDQAGRGGM